jgi:hypothetical protein
MPNMACAKAGPAAQRKRIKNKINWKLLFMAYTPPCPGSCPRGVKGASISRIPCPRLRQKQEPRLSIPHGLDNRGLFGKHCRHIDFRTRLVGPFYEPARRPERIVKVCGALGPDRRGLGGATPLLSPGCVCGRTPVRMLFTVADLTTHRLFLQRTPVFQNARLLCTVRFNN